MAKWPNWKDIKQTLDDPERKEELKGKVQGGVERGRTEAAKRLAGPAAHLRKVGSQFKAGMNDLDANRPDPVAPPAGETPPGAPAAPPEPQP